LEHLTGEILRRTDVAGLFPNGTAIYRLLVAMPREQNDERSSRRRHCILETLASLGEDHNISMTAAAAGKGPAGGMRGMSAYAAPSRSAPMIRVSGYIRPPAKQLACPQGQVNRLCISLRAPCHDYQPKSGS